MLLAPLLLICAAGSPAQTNLEEASLEQLVQVKVTSVAKKEQPLFRAAAAVFVIGEEEIRRSGATSIPDLLRMVPGVYVARIDANAWAISIRGFSARYSNKVLVLIDGRTVYTPSFSGVFWDHEDLPLEDIQRIEVIRGPGATMWGANAVNGVINIITKPAKATQGGLMTASVASGGSGEGSVRYGGTVGGGGWYRVFGKYSREADLPRPNGLEGADGWNRKHGGFRSDWEISGRDSLTVAGDLYHNHAGQSLWPTFLPLGPTNVSINQAFAVDGGNLLGRWTRSHAGGSSTSLQVYYDSYDRTDLGVPEKMRRADADFQHHFRFGGRHDVVWGLGIRTTTSGLEPGHSIAFNPPERTDRMYSTFVQDEIEISNSLCITVGSKFEHNVYAGFDMEPSARIAWTPNRRQTIWGAASQANREPSRVDTAMAVTLGAFPGPGGVVQVLRLDGNPRFRPERLRELELGYRAELSRKVTFDLTAFRSFYRGMQAVEAGVPYFAPGTQPVEMVLPWLYTNKGKATTYGGEISVNWQAAPRWRISPGYAFLQMNVNASLNPLLPPGPTPADTPKHLLEARSYLNLTRNLDFDSTLYFAGPVASSGTPTRARLDSRLAWRAGESVELSVVGQDLLRPHQLEFGDSLGVIGTQVERRVYGKIAWSF